MGPRGYGLKALPRPELVENEDRSTTRTAYPIGPLVLRLLFPANLGAHSASWLVGSMVSSSAEAQSPTLPVGLGARILNFD